MFIFMNKMFRGFIRFSDSAIDSPPNQEQFLKLIPRFLKVTLHFCYYCHEEYLG